MPPQRQKIAAALFFSTLKLLMAFSTLSPDPSLLVWDSEPQVSSEGFRSGWLKVPVLHDSTITKYVASPSACLRVLMKPARVQPARLGPILMHCGGPGSDAKCAEHFGAKFLEVSSPHVVTPALSDDYDYWSISQRGMKQQLFGSVSCPFTENASASAPSRSLQAWPEIRCTAIESLRWKSGLSEVLKRLDGNPDEKMWSWIQDIVSGTFDPYTFGVPYYNETYVRWLYRVTALEHNLCLNDEQFQIRSAATRGSFNMLQHVSTSDLARDIEIFRKAIGAEQMSIYGVSYGTKVASVYATIFPDKIHRLILDGDMGSDPDIQVFATWVGQSTEAVWTGLAEACDNSVMGGAPAGERCSAGPGVTTKVYKIFRNAETPTERRNAAALNSAFRGLLQPGVPRAPFLMECISAMTKSPEDFHCHDISRYSLQHAGYDEPPVGALGQIGAVLGLDLGGRLTEQSFIEWWRVIKDTQPLGITHSLAFTAAVSSWPALPQPQPPAGDSHVAPLVIGNLFDGQTPYKNAQRMVAMFPNGVLLTSQFYGHGLQPPRDLEGVVRRYEAELKSGESLIYDNEVAKLLCMKVVLLYLQSGKLPRDHVCKAAGPAKVGPGNLLTNDMSYLFDGSSRHANNFLNAELSGDAVLRASIGMVGPPWNLTSNAGSVDSHPQESSQDSVQNLIRAGAVGHAPLQSARSGPTQGRPVWCALVFAMGLVTAAVAGLQVIAKRRRARAAADAYSMLA